MTLTIEENVLLKPYTTYKIGGLARFFCKVKNIDELRQVISFAKENSLPFRVIGKGSNVLFDDRGYSGVIIVNQLNQFAIKGEIVTAESGVSFSYLGMKTMNRGLCGLEFALGIPGSVGGAVVMNAGAMKAEIRHVLQAATILDEKGIERFMTPEDLSMSYRFSLLQQNRDWIVLEATFQLRKDSEAKKRGKEHLAYRTASQPYNAFSCGSVFKNPLGHCAAQIIDSLSLKGERIGDAVVSQKHANFIINCGSATSEDILLLIQKIQTKVKNETGIDLFLEVKYIPYDG